MEIGAFNFSGLASGFDTRALIDAILRVERRPIERLQSRESSLNQQQSALDELRGKLNGFLTTLRDLSSERIFKGRVATVSDDSYFTANAGTAAESGVFSIEVLQLAATHKVSSNGFSASDQSQVSGGTITLQTGVGEVLTIDVSASSANDSLEGVRDAINAADVGVAASVLYDGTEYKLIVRAEESGLANALTITDTTNLGLADPANELIAAADASVTVDTIPVTSSSNKISGVLDGVTLDLLQVTGGTPVTLQVADDVEGVVEAVGSLVEKYNEVTDFLNAQLNRENPGPLSDDSYVRRLQGTLQTLVTAGVDGIPIGGIRSLASVGVSFDGLTGRLSLDSAELTELLETQFDEVGDLFVSSGSTTDPLIRFLSGGSAVSGTYGVEVTQAAEKATVAGSGPIGAAGLLADETLTLTVNSQAVVVDLLAGQTITDVVDTVNTALDAAGAGATASDDGGSLRISTDEYGSAQTLSVGSSLNDDGSGNQSGFDDDNPAASTGIDVAGRIDGVDATGAGRTLTTIDTGGSAGLSVLVTASAADVTTSGGDFGTVSYSAGLTAALIDELEGATRLGDGQIDSSKEIIDGQLRQIADDILRLEERLSSREARLVRQFAEAERAISILQSQQNSLGGFIPR